jgi:hypothetical protein
MGSHKHTSTKEQTQIRYRDIDELIDTRNQMRHLNPWIQKPLNYDLSTAVIIVLL